MAEQCPMRMRPFRGATTPDALTIEIQCESGAEHATTEHIGVLRDYAFAGSRTEIHWFDGDRREFRGEWPGACLRRGLLPPCILPTGHRGGCAT